MSRRWYLSLPLVCSLRAPRLDEPLKLSGVDVRLAELAALGSASAIAAFGVTLHVPSRQMRCTIALVATLSLAGATTPGPVEIVWGAPRTRPIRPRSVLIDHKLVPTSCTRAVRR